MTDVTDVTVFSRNSRSDLHEDISSKWRHICHVCHATEQTDFPSKVAEMALAHAVGDKVGAEYRRGDMFEKRRQLAEAWARLLRAPGVRASVMWCRSGA